MCQYNILVQLALVVYKIRSFMSVKIEKKRRRNNREVFKFFWPVEMLIEESESRPFRA